jgi:hypothetical protein
MALELRTPRVTKQREGVAEQRNENENENGYVLFNCVRKYEENGNERRSGT